MWISVLTLIGSVLRSQTSTDLLRFVKKQQLGGHKGNARELCVPQSLRSNS